LLAQSLSLEQPLLHALAPQVYGEHMVVVGAGQEPVPAQLAAAVATPEAQLAERQLVDEPG
jgi:hypothetical protein